MATCTIQNNFYNKRVIKYTNGKKSEIHLYPGINLGVDEGEWDNAISKHPAVKDYLERGKLVKIKSVPNSEGEYKGFNVYTDKENRDEPTPILEAQTKGEPLKTETETKTKSRRGRGRPKKSEVSTNTESEK